MSTKLILLWNMPDELMLIVEHPSGVRYQNQVGGVVCDQPQLEGVLAPVDVSTAAKELIQNCPYPGRQGITPELADTIDAILESEPRARFLTVDRARLDDSQEAWVHILINSPEETNPDLEESYFGSVHGFGAARGVLTWINSD